MLFIRLAAAGRVPSPEGKVARRKPGRKRNGDTLTLGVGTKRCINLKFSARIPLQSRFARQLPPGGSYGALRALSPQRGDTLTNVNNNLPYETLMLLRMALMAPFSSRDTWAWEMPKTPATSIWVLPS